MNEDFERFANARPEPTPAEAKKKATETAQKAKVPKLSAAQVKAATAEMTAEQEGAERAQLLRKIELYMQHFGDRLTYRPPKRLTNKTSSAELHSVVASIENELGMGGGIDMVCEAFGQSGILLEAITQRFNPLNLQLRGPISLAATIQANRERWEPLAVEFAIKYERYFCMGVESRIISFLATTVMTVHRANVERTKAEHAFAQGKAQQPISAELQRELEESSSGGISS